MKQVICKKTKLTAKNDVAIGGVVFKKQLGFDQLRRCIDCDDSECISKVLGKGKLTRRRGI